MITISGDSFNKLSLATVNCHNFKGHNEFTNVAFRISYFLHVMRGANDLESLMFYSKHMGEYSDNGKDLRGSLGPRLRFWLGIDHLQEAIDINQDIDDEEDFVKPNGIDQLKMAYQDLHNGMAETTIIIRDPAIDFDDTNDVPDIISMQFSVIEKENAENILCMAVSYGQINMASNFVNELWVLMHIGNMYKNWLHCFSFQLNITSLCDSNDVSVEEVLSSEMDFGNEPDTQWQMDLETLETLEKHIRLQVIDHSKTPFNESRTVRGGLEVPGGDISEINVGIMVEELKESLVSKIQNKYLQEMGMVLIICSACQLDSVGFEDFIIENYKSMETTLRVELAEYLLEAKTFSSADQEMFTQDLNG
tara:strand:+ start:58 stop:1149 length:1092 start_codon:yes stop_codon:yes gene_type:complete